MNANEAGEAIPLNRHNDGLPLVSIVILNWNGKSFLQRFLPSVLASTYANKRVIVADNGSTDDSIAFMKEFFPEVKLLVSATNEGFANGYNRALKQVGGTYHVLLNSDVEVEPGWIEPVIALMEQDLTIAACQPKIRSYGNRIDFEYAGASGGWLDRWGYPFARGRVFGYLERDQGQYDNAAPCFWASGAAMFVRAAAFREVGGLDGYFFAHQEEIDLCWRLQLAGHQVFVQPASIVYHVGGGTLSKESNYKNFLNFRNNLVMLAKNLAIGPAIGTICIRICLDAIAAWKELLGGNAAFFGAVFRSHVYFVTWLLRDRKRSVFPIAKKGRLQGWYAGSIVWQHFIQKKNTFAEIVRPK